MRLRESKRNVSAVQQQQPLPLHIYSMHSLSFSLPLDGVRSICHGAITALTPTYIPLANTASIRLSSARRRPDYTHLSFLFSSYCSLYLYTHTHTHIYRYIQQACGKQTRRRMWRKVGATASTTIDGQPKRGEKEKKRFLFFGGPAGVDNIS